MRRTDSPSPNKYNISSDFDLTKKNLSMGKFGVGREVMLDLFRKLSTMGYS